MLYINIIVFGTLLAVSRRVAHTCEPTLQDHRARLRDKRPSRYLSVWNHDASFSKIV